MTIAMQDYLRDELGVSQLQDLGQGGFADVYSGEREEVLQAFKVSRAPLDQKLRDMAAQELSFLKHPTIRACDQIVQLLGVHWHKGHLITRWQLGEQSLGDRLKAYASEGRAGLPPDELPRYLRDVALGIDVVNEMGIRHRDIKPDNLLLFLNGRVKVADFGLALFTGASTMSKTTSGTMGYIALEAYGTEAGERGKLTGTIDIYALAATAIKLATGNDPFGQIPPEIFDAQRAGRPVTTGLTPSQTAAVVAALHPDPAQRPFNSAIEFTNAFLGDAPPPDLETVAAVAPRDGDVVQRMKQLADLASDGNAEARRRLQAQDFAGASAAIESRPEGLRDVALLAAAQRGLAEESQCLRRIAELKGQIPVLERKGNLPGLRHVFEKLLWLDSSCPDWRDARAGQHLKGEVAEVVVGGELPVRVAVSLHAVELLQQSATIVERLHIGRLRERQTGRSEAGHRRITDRERRVMQAEMRRPRHVRRLRDRDVGRRG